METENKYALFCTVTPNLSIGGDESFRIVNNYIWVDPSSNAVMRLFLSPLKSVTPRDFYIFTESILAETFATIAWRLPEGLLDSAAPWLRDSVRAAGPTGGALVNVAIVGPRFSGGVHEAVLLGYHTNNDQEDEEEESNNEMVPTNKGAIEALEEVEIARVSEVRASYDDEDGLCAICLDELVLLLRDDRIDCGEDCRKIVRMPCSHVYHKDCLVRWLEKSHVCPLCRFAMPTSLGDH